MEYTVNTIIFSEWLDKHLNFVEKRLTDVANGVDEMVLVLREISRSAAAWARATERLASAAEAQLALESARGETGRKRGR